MTGLAARVLVLIVVASALVVARSEAAPPTPKRTVDGKVTDWTGASSRFGGTWQYSRGEFVYQDHIYDDLGADTRQRSQQHGSVTGAPAGDYRYPAAETRYANNAADLLELRFAADRTSVWILARMNTLKAPDTTVVAIGIDTDRKISTGSGAWPFAAGLDVPGVDRVITLRSTSSTLTKLPDSKPARIGEVAVNTANEHNAIEARIPRSALGGDNVRLYAATGLWDKTTGEWMAPRPGSPSATAPGGGNPLFPARAFNVAFRADETGSFMEELQAAALMSGDISAFRADLDVNALASRVDRPYNLKTGRFYAVVMKQKVTIPPLHEGVAYDGIDGRFQGVGGNALTQEFSFYGPHQPYGMYVPKRYDGRTPIGAALALHGHGGSHNTYNSQPGFVADMGDGEGTKLPPLFLITPLARGSSFYADWGEADTLEVLRDVFTHFKIDRSRLYLTGYSMGGYGVYRLASLYPDMFAAAASWAGYTGEFTGSYLTDPRWIAGDPTGSADAVAAMIRPVLAEAGIGGGRAGKAAIGDPVDTMENLRHLPLVHLAGTNDEIVPTTGQYAAPRRLAELGYRSRFDLYAGYEHYSFALVDDWKVVREWLGNTRRVIAPRDITYRFSDGWTQKGLASSLGLDHGNAWWLRDMTMRKTTEDGLELATVNAKAWAIAARTMTPASSVTPALMPTPHIRNEVSWTPGAPRPVSNRVDLTTSGVGSLTIDLARAKLELCGLKIALRTDGPLKVTLVSATPKETRSLGVSKMTTTVLTVGC